MQMIPPRNSDINSLNSKFRTKFDLRWKEVTSKYPNAVVFEAQRTQERQNYLYSLGRTRPGKIVTWTLNSNHLNGGAVDIVFRNNGVIERKGPYGDLITMGKKYGIRNLAPKELCHFEDDGTIYNGVGNYELSCAKKAIDGNSTYRDSMTYPEMRSQLETTNDMIRAKYGL